MVGKNVKTFILLNTMPWHATMSVCVIKVGEKKNSKIFKAKSNYSVPLS